ncbi:hypothetical protein EN738_32595, partial [Mesorhizobium sp. M4B.F.Ca.ET.017.02.2.1]
MFRRALEALAQHRVLRRDADRAGIEMALAHHDAAGRDVIIGALLGADEFGFSTAPLIAAGAQAAIDLQ